MILAILLDILGEFFVLNKLKTAIHKMTSEIFVAVKVVVAY